MLYGKNIQINFKYVADCDLNFKIKDYEKQRAYYDMTAKDNIFTYMTGEVDKVGRPYRLDYVGNSTGVFNRDGVLSNEQIKIMQERLKKHTGRIYYGFISTPENLGYKINSPQKCIRLLKCTFRDFCKDARLDPDNIDMMCSLHSKVEDHIHFHFVFWEREKLSQTRIKGFPEGEFHYSRLDIPKKAFDRLLLRMDMFMEKEEQLVTYSKNDVYVMLGKLIKFNHGPIRKSQDIRAELVDLAKALPSSEKELMLSDLPEEVQKKVDKVTRHLIYFDKKARKADLNFYKAVEELKRKYQENEISKQKEYEEYNLYDKIINREVRSYKWKLNSKVLAIAKFVKPECFERDKKYIYQTNDRRLKKRKAISKTHVSQLLSDFLKSFGREADILYVRQKDRLMQVDKIIKNNNYCKGGKR